MNKIVDLLGRPFRSHGNGSSIVGPGGERISSDSGSKPEARSTLLQDGNGAQPGPSRTARKSTYELRAWLLPVSARTGFFER